MLDAAELLNGYYNGIFPMADNDGSIFWYSPELRAIIPIENYRPSKSLRPIINQKKFEIRFNYDFPSVISACSEPRSGENSTWISNEIIAAYIQLFKLGFAISVEAYQNNVLVGGLYGVTLGKAFFGESMFHRVSNSSKVAFHYLLEYLRENNYQLLDSQFINDNVKRYGAVEIPKSDYIKKLRLAVAEVQILNEINTN